MTEYTRDELTAAILVTKADLDQANAKLAAVTTQRDALKAALQRIADGPGSFDGDLDYEEVADAMAVIARDGLTAADPMHDPVCGEGGICLACGDSIAKHPAYVTQTPQ